MSYERAMLEALINGDERRIAAIQRLNNTVACKEYNGYSWGDEINDKLIALTGRNSDEIYADSFPRKW